MLGDKPTSGDDQQGRPLGDLPPHYIAGFVDGEGCFSVSIHPHLTTKSRWLLGPAFQVYQHRDNVGILELIRDFFGRGRIAAKGPRSSVMTYSVYRRSDLEGVIIPFFDRFPLLSRKQEDFLKFKEVVLAMQKGEHRTDEGFLRLARIAFTMNQRGKQRRYQLEDVLRNPQRLHAEQLW